MEKTLAQIASPIVRVAFVGPECTGKTTLSSTLAQRYHTVWAEEYMRTYLQHKWDTQHLTCTWGDLLPIAQGQVQLENERVRQASTFLFCDTCLLELMIYAYLYYGQCPPEIEQAALSHRYQHLFLTYVDVPWQADDLRDKPNEREEVFTFFKDKLDSYGIAYQVLKGSVAERIRQCTEKLLL
jgi:nadR-like protein